MSDPIYVSRSTVSKVAGVHRRATIAADVTFDIGVHGEIKSHYRLDDARDLPLPVDYIVAATGS